MLVRVTVVTLSVTLFVCVSLFYFGEGAVFRVQTYINSALNVALFFENQSYFGEKASGTLTITAVIYSGLAREILAHRTLYKVVICIVPASVSSLRIVISMVAGLQTAFLSANSKLVCY